MAVTVTVCGQAAASVPASGNNQPVNQSLPVPVTNVTGDWMIAVATWRQAAANAGVTVSLGDDAHNWWEPLGSPAGTSGPAGVTRSSIWVAPAARAASMVMAAPTGLVQALAVTVLDVAGLLPWLQVTGVMPSFTSNGTALPLTLGAPPAQALAITCCGTDLNTATVSFTGTGWTGVAAVSASNGTDHTADITLHAQWKLVTGAQSPTWSASPALDLAGVIAAVLVSPTPPVQPNANYPIVITEAAPGAGVQTPADGLNWLALSARSLDFQAQQGQPYLLAGLQGGQGTLSLDNPDGSLIPPGNGVYAGIDSGTPLRVRTIWPASATPHSVFWSGFLQQVPQAWDTQTLRGHADTTLTDAYGYATRSLPPCYRSEVQQDAPYAFWPLDDAAGSTAGANLAAGNQNPLTVVPSKYGPGTGISYAFGGNSGVMKGGPAGMWGLTVPGSPFVQGGYSLLAADGNFPPTQDTVTLEFWFQAVSPFGATAAPSYVALWCTGHTQGVHFQLDVPASQGGTGKLQLLTSPGTWTNIGSVNYQQANSPFTHVVLTFNRSTWTAWIDGNQAASGSWGINIAPRLPYLVFNGTAGLPAPAAPSGVAVAFSGLYAGYTAGAAVYAGALPLARIQAHYAAGSTAFAQENASQRIERILGYAGLPGRRVILPETSPSLTRVASMSTLGGTGPGTGVPGFPGFSPGTGTTASAALQGTATATAPGLLTMARTGDVFYLAKQYTYNQPTVWTLGDGPGEIPFLGDVQLGYDPGLVKNDIQLTQPDTGAVTVPSLGATEAASQLQYGDQSYQPTTYLYSVTSPVSPISGSQDLADWLAATNARPALRGATITIDAARHPTAWPMVAQVNTGDMVVFSIRPPTSPGLVISVTGRVAQVTPALAFSQESVAGAVQLAVDTAPEASVLTADDPVRGQLDGTHALAW